MSDYGVKDIKTLEGIKAIRLRPGMYVGSVGPAGVRHITLEIISNAVDEYLNGHCTFCHIHIDSNGVIRVQDNGRGVPLVRQKMVVRHLLMSIPNFILVQSLIVMVKLDIILPVV